MACKKAEIREDFSLTYFRDFSLGPLIQEYNVTYIFDSSNGLSATNVTVRFVWSDEGVGPLRGFLVIKWMDTQPPVILESQIVNLGNGTLLIATIVTDSSEFWLGSGVKSENISLFDIRRGSAWLFPQEAVEIALSPTINLFIFRISYNHIIDTSKYPEWSGDEDFFQFNFSDILSFTVNVTDRAGWTDSYVHEPQHMSADTNLPQFLLQDNVM